MSAQKDERKFWLEWLNRYKSFQCLWDAETRRLAGNYERDAAYQELADLAKFVNPDADINYVRRRINSLRTSYKREHKRVQAAKAKGTPYTPTLFYYDTLKQFVDPDTDQFDPAKILYGEESETDPISSPELKDKLIKDKLINKIISKNDPEKNILDNLLSYNFEAEMAKSEISSKPKNIRANIVNKSHKTSSNEYEQASAGKRKYEPTEETVLVDCDLFESSYRLKSPPIKSLENLQDEYDILGKRIAEHFRNMTLNQRLFAEKIISDVCIYGRMDKLTMESTLLVEPGE